MTNSNTHCVIALSFGQKSNKSKVNTNKEIAILASSFGLPVIAQKEIAIYCRHPCAVITNHNGYLSTWTVLTEAKYIMEKEGYDKAIMVAHNVHVNRAEKHAAKLRINYTAPRQLPTKMDRYSLQWWTRSLWQWRIHELVNMPKLKLQKRI